MLLDLIILIWLLASGYWWVVALFVGARGELEIRAGEQRTLVAASLRELLPADALAMPKGKNWA